MGGSVLGRAAWALSVVGTVGGWFCFGPRLVGAYPGGDGRWVVLFWVALCGAFGGGDGGWFCLGMDVILGASHWVMAEFGMVTKL